MFPPDGSYTIVHFCNVEELLIEGFFYLFTLKELI